MNQILVGGPLLQALAQPANFFGHFIRCNVLRNQLEAAR